MPPNDSEIRIQVHANDLEWLREMFGSQAPEKGQVVETDGYKISFRGVSRSHGMTQQDITILIAINVATSLLTSATTSLLAYWIFSKLSRDGRFPLQIGSDPYYKTTSAEIEDAIKNAARSGSFDDDGEEGTTQRPSRTGEMPSSDEKTAMRRQLSSLLEEQLKDIAHDLGLSSYISSKASASELSRSIVQAASQSSSTWRWLQEQLRGPTSPTFPTGSEKTEAFTNATSLGIQTGSAMNSASATDDSAKRFLVALTFPGERRDFVDDVAFQLLKSLSKSQVFYDHFHRSELARPNLDTYLQDIYHKQSALVVVFLCEAYAEKEWCGLEFRAVRSLIKQRRDDQIMFVRLDKGPISGVFDIDGYLDAQGQTAQFVCDAILERVRTIDARIDGAKRLTQQSVASVVSEFDKLTLGKPHSVCRQIVLATLSDRSERWGLLQWKSERNVKTFEQLLWDADAMLISSDQYLGYVQKAHVAKAICLIGKGLCGFFVYSSSLERLFVEIVDKITQLTDVDLAIDDEVSSRVLVRTDRDDLQSAIGILGFEVELE